MMTGRWPQQNGLLGLTHHGFKLNPGEQHAAALFAGAGFETTLFHFQHVAERGDWPKLGFHEFLCQSRDEEESVYPHMARPAAEVAAAFTDWLTMRPTGAPFFAQVNFNETHVPFWFGGVEPQFDGGVTVPPWIAQDETAERYFAHLRGSVEALDRGIALILASLEESGSIENTLVVFCTDHGIEAARDKWTLYESGLGIAAAIHWPKGGITGGRRITTPLSNVDLLPTLLEAAGINPPSNLSGKSFLRLLRGESQPELEERPIFALYHNTGCRSVRLGNWKLILNFAAEPYQRKAPVHLDSRDIPASARPPAELYNLAEDPHELRNCVELNAGIALELRTLLGEWMKLVGDPCLAG
jgi:N-sulfoglucosamine sulfohydrolase